MEIKQPLVSIMLPCYNSERTLPMALASILSQCYSNWECIIVNDGSTDETDLICSSLGDKRFRYYKFEKNAGRGVARQYALAQMKGKYLAMIDADDWWYPWKLQRQIDEILSVPGLKILSCGIAVYNDNGKLISIRSYATDNKLIIKVGTSNVLHHMPFPFPSSIVNMDIAKQTGFDPQLRRSQDADFVFRSIINEKYGVLPDVLYAYYYGNAISKRERLLNLKCRLLFMRKFIAIYPLLSITIVVKTFLKLIAIKALPEEKMKLISQEKSNVTAYDIEQYEKARKIVEEYRNRLVTIIV